MPRSGVAALSPFPLDIVIGAHHHVLEGVTRPALLSALVEMTTPVFQLLPGPLPLAASAELPAALLALARWLAPAAPACTVHPQTTGLSSAEHPAPQWLLLLCALPCQATPAHTSKHKDNRIQHRRGCNGKGAAHPPTAHQAGLCGPQTHASISSRLQAAQRFAHKHSGEF